MDNVQLGRGPDGADRPSSRSGAMRRLGLPAAALGIALGAAQVAAAAPSLAATSTSSARVAVGHAPALPKGAVSATAPAASKKLSLDVELNTGHATALSAYANAVANRNSPYYHQYLSPSQVAEYFGASQTEVSAVQASLQAQGLTVGSLSTDGMFLSVSGTVAQAEHAFNVTIKGYQAAGRSIYANTTAPTVSASIAGDVSGIVGMDNVDYARPQYVTTHHTAGVAATKALTSQVTSNYTNNSCSSIAATFSGSGMSNGSGYYTADAISNIYGLNKTLANGDDGAGVTVAVFELENYDPTGVAQLDSCYGHSASVSEVKVDGGPSAAANLYTQVGSESALDIENIANQAPGVKIIDYAGPDYTTATDAQILDTFGAIFNQDKANVVSTSWGLCETLTQEGSSTFQSSENTLFQQAAVQGQTVIAASGDDGSTACYNQGVTADNSILNTSDPASQPYVLGVGGTTMTGLSNPTPSVWNYLQDVGGTFYGGASGGGLSNYWPLPSYQSGATASGYTTNCTTTVISGGTGCRQVPDVSALADPYEGYVIDEYYNATINGVSYNGEYYFSIGGTSGAAPVWAAVIALVDASTQCRLNGEAGFVNPSLYTAGESSSAAAATFTDVTSGNNQIADYGATYGYPAGTGYDMATGWGTPNASGIAANTCQAPITSTGSYYQADGPIRLMDTRSGSFHVGSVTGPIAANGTAKLPIVGNSLLTGNSAVPTGATAAVLNVTVTQPTNGGNATVYPDGEAMPLTSNLNWAKGNTVPNLVVVPLKTDGAVDIANNSSGTVQFIADLEGYYTTSTSVNSVTSSSYTPISPLRALDTRSGGNGVSKAKIAAGTGVSLQLGGATISPVGGGTAVPIPSGITGVAMNVTVTNATGGGFLTVYPTETTSGSPVTLPNVSNLNFATGETVPNMVMVPVGADGKVRFYNGATAGSTDIIADIAGYYTADTKGEVYHPLGPVRLIDTRIGEGETSTAPIPAKGTLSLGLPSSYEAVIANVTVTGAVGGGFITVFPKGTAMPNASNL
ncbi:MAG TPA: S53 family peptidase, partial [Actinospica sp.]|nr:S53 family peptidase [Actinospica sp.]